MKLKILRWLGCGLLALVVLAIIAVFAFRAHVQHRLGREARITAPNGIDEAKYVDVNGAQEWITIRGQNRNNPVILFLHGGPDEANSPFVTFYLPFEKNYVFVQWDQPGAGMTYIKGGDHQPRLSLDATASDGIAVAEYLRNELHQPKIILIGQDWGGLVGIRMIEKRPDLFAAFVGTGQIVGMMAGQQWQYEYALRQATASNDSKMLAALKQVGPPPWAQDGYDQFQDCCRNRLLAAEDVAAMNRMRGMLVFSPSLTISRAYGWYKGLRSGEEELHPVLFTMKDLRETDTKFSAPVFFIQGADDIVTPPSLVADYVARIQAPMKRLDVVPNAGFFVMWTNPEEFLRYLDADVQDASNAKTAAN
jgi:pimeloyl-ACP methyl ester carboxylesterase